MFNRRYFLQSTSALGATLAMPSLRANPLDQAPLTLDFESCFQALESGSTTSVTLVEACIQRIQAMDNQGPQLHAVLEINPDAKDIAAERDRERLAGKRRGPLHGMPVLLKDNIATGDRLLTTAGSLALAGKPAARDAFLVTQLREAGAVILGKTNLSEWANIRSSRSTSGWSARGGQTRNPHVLDRNPSGSSAGSAVAVSALYAPLAVGSETDGSIVSPASVCGVVGIKPTVGRVSRAGIIPISRSQDTAGPMATSVRGAALLLAAMSVPDPQDAACRGAPPALDLSNVFRQDGLAGARLGVARAHFTTQPDVIARTEEAIGLMRKLGAEIIDPVELTLPDAYGEAELEVMLTELREDMSHYLAQYAPDAPVHSLADIVDWNKAHAKDEMAFFGQELFERALKTGALDSAKYRAARALCLKLARTDGIDATMDKHKLDAIIVPTGDPAWLTDWINGDRSGATFATPAAVAGYPHICVPSGFVNDLPVALSFVGRAYQEATLIRLAYAYEHASKMWRAPRFIPTIGDQLGRTL